MRANTKCRSCLAPMRWAVSEATNKRIPLDPDAVPDGNIYVLRWEEGTPVVIVAATPADVPGGEALRYKTHFATCPQAQTWRKG
jgi:hypothetical protein